MQRRSWCLLLIFAALVASVPAQAPAQSLSKGRGDLRVMTWNVNEGTDYKEVIAARNSTEFVIGVGAAIKQVRLTEPATRMKYVAQQIIAAGPAMVSLQELDQWSTGPFDPVSGKCGPVSVEFDKLPALITELKNHSIASFL